jgi:hypothetical protein
MKVDAASSRVDARGEITKLARDPDAPGTVAARRGRAKGKCQVVLE